MLNGIFVTLVLASVLLAALTGSMQTVTHSIVDSAKTAVELALKLIGVMALFLGLMRVAEDGGLLRIIARLADPLLRRLFPGVPRGHPAMSAMILNVSSNMLGLGNAATPFGIKAMIELDRLNGERGTATNAMVVFLALNTSGLSFLPTTAIAARSAVDSADPAGILFPTFFATSCAAAVGVASALLLSRLHWYRQTEPPPATTKAATSSESAHRQRIEQATTRSAPPRPPRLGCVVAVSYALLLAGGLIWHVARSVGHAPWGAITRELLSFWSLPFLVAGLVLFGWARGVKVYNSVVEGAREGFQVAVRIIPYLVAILVMVGMFRASGGMQWLVRLLDGFTAPLGMPAEALPMALLRPLSGSGAYAVMTEIMKTHGADTLIGYMVSTLQGSTETTFYVLAVYFGSVSVRRTRHALPSCLLADLAGISAAVLIVNLVFGG